MDDFVKNAAAECRSMVSEIRGLQLELIIEGNRKEGTCTKAGFDGMMSRAIKKLKSQIRRTELMLDGFKNIRHEECNSWVVDGVPFDLALARIAAAIHNALEYSKYNDPGHPLYKLVKLNNFEPRYVDTGDESVLDWIRVEDGHASDIRAVLEVPQDGDPAYRYQCDEKVYPQDIERLAGLGIEVEDVPCADDCGFAHTIFRISRDDPHGRCSPRKARSLPLGIEDQITYPRDLIGYNVGDFERLLGCDRDFEGAFNRCGYVMYKTIEYMDSYEALADALDPPPPREPCKSPDRDARLSIARALNASEERHDAVTKEYIGLPEFSCQVDDGMVTACALVPSGLDGDSVDRLAAFGFEVTKVDVIAEGSATARIHCRGPDDPSLDSDVPRGYWGWSVSALISDYGMKTEKNPWLAREVSAGNEYVGDYLEDLYDTRPTS